MAQHTDNQVITDLLGGVSLRATNQTATALLGTDGDDLLIGTPNTPILIGGDGDDILIAPSFSRAAVPTEDDVGEADEDEDEDTDVVDDEDEDEDEDDEEDVVDENGEDTDVEDDEDTDVEDDDEDTDLGENGDNDNDTDPDQVGEVDDDNDNDLIADLPDDITDIVDDLPEDIQEDVENVLNGEDPDPAEDADPADPTADPAQPTAPTVAGSGPGYVLLGGAGNDILVGSDNNDVLYGDDGNDVLVGGLGDDIHRGGDGADLFVYTGGNDTVRDFDFDEGDRLLVATGATLDDLVAALEAATEEDGEDDPTAENGEDDPTEDDGETADDTADNGAVGGDTDDTTGGTASGLTEAQAAQVDPQLLGQTFGDGNFVLGNTLFTVQDGEVVNAQDVTGQTDIPGTTAIGPDDLQILQTTAEPGDAPAEEQEDTGEETAEITITEADGATTIQFDEDNSLTLNGVAVADISTDWFIA